VDRFAELDLFFSFAGNITYKKSPEIREAVRLVPSNRLLLETDAPYLSPQPVRHKINHPGFIGYTYEAAAREREMPLEELITLVEANFIDFLSLSGRFVP
jgi:TatD DNase family protein